MLTALHYLLCFTSNVSPHEKSHHHQVTHLSCFLLLVSVRYEYTLEEGMWKQDLIQGTLMLGQIRKENYSKVSMIYWCIKLKMMNIYVNDLIKVMMLFVQEHCYDHSFDESWEKLKRIMMASLWYLWQIIDPFPDPLIKCMTNKVQKLISLQVFFSVHKTLFWRFWIVISALHTTGMLIYWLLFMINWLKYCCNIKLLIFSESTK